MTHSPADLALLPADVGVLVQTLAALPGAVGVALGGSRGAGGADHGSDWDLGVYYRGAIELSALQAYGEVHPPGSWGRIMNGGCWARRVSGRSETPPTSARGPSGFDRSYLRRGRCRLTVAARSQALVGD